MNDKYDSFLEIVVALMKKKKKPQSLETLTKEVFSKKGVEGNELQIAQFQVDFMLSGYFVCCGEDKQGNPLWDLKTRQESSLLDKDSGYRRDLSEEDEEASINELKDDNQFGDHDDLDQYFDDDDEEINEQDDIEEDLGLVALDEESEKGMDEIINEDFVEEEDEDDF